MVGIESMKLGTIQYIVHFGWKELTFLVSIDHKKQSTVCVGEY